MLVRYYLAIQVYGGLKFELVNNSIKVAMRTNIFILSIRCRNLMSKLWTLHLTRTSNRGIVEAQSPSRLFL